jgi:hypothetical protein
VVPEGTNINPDLDSEKRNCKSQDLMTNLADLMQTLSQEVHGSQYPQQHAQPTPDHIDPHMQLGHPEGTNINPDLDSEKRNCKSQDLMTNLADEKLNQDTNSQSVFDQTAEQNLMQTLSQEVHGSQYPQQHAQPNPDLDSEKRNCKSQDLMTNLADEKLNQDKWLVDNPIANPCLIKPQSRTSCRL